MSLVACLGPMQEMRMNVKHLPPLSAFWEWGSPDLPACGPRCGFAGRPVRPIFINQELRPSRGGRHKTSSGAASPCRLVRGGESKVGQTSQGFRDVSHDDRDQAGASPRNVLISSLVQRGQAQVRSPEESSNGFHFSATRPRPPGRRSSPDAFAGEAHF